MQIRPQLKKQMEVNTPGTNSKWPVTQLSPSTLCVCVVSGCESVVASANGMCCLAATSWNLPYWARDIPQTAWLLRVTEFRAGAYRLLLHALCKTTTFMCHWLLLHSRVILPFFALGTYALHLSVFVQSYVVVRTDLVSCACYYYTAPMNASIILTTKSNKLNKIEHIDKYSK